MKHDELLAKIDTELATNYADECGNFPIGLKALRAVVELHKPVKNWYDGNDEITDCRECSELVSDSVLYPCPTIQAIEKELG